MAGTERALLVCAGGGIGDSLVATLVARALHTRYANVDALTLPAHRALLERVPDVSRIFVDGGAPAADLAATLRNERFAAAVVTWATPRTAEIPRLAGIPIRVGQGRRLYSYKFTHRVRVRSESGDVVSHWSQILLDYARAIGCDTSDTYPIVLMTECDERDAEDVLGRLQLRDRAFCIVHATNALAPQRNWPTRGWVSLVTEIRKTFGLPVLLSGTAADVAIVDAIAAQSGGISIASAASLGAFASLARRAHFFVGITTGSMHVAAAVGTPTIGVFPFQTDTPERWSPLGPHTAVVRATFPCRPGERKETCPDYACVANLDVPRIIAAIESLTVALAPR